MGGNQWVFPAQCQSFIWVIRSTTASRVPLAKLNVYTQCPVVISLLQNCMEKEFDDNLYERYKCLMIELCLRENLSLCTYPRQRVTAQRDRPHK